MGRAGRACWMRRTGHGRHPLREKQRNVFADIGFSSAEVEELTIKSALIGAIDATIKERKLTQKAAALCDTDQPTLSKVLRGRMDSVTIDRLTAWLMALGRTVEIRVRPYDPAAKAGHLVVVA